MTATDDHGDLPAHAALMVERLDTLHGRFVYGRVGNHLHTEHAERCRILANHLSAMLTLCGSRHYVAGLVVARTALEHHLLDRLVFLANRWLQVEQGIKTTGLAAENARLANLKATTRPDIVKWWWDPKPAVMKVLIRGLFQEGKLGRGPTISPYWMHIDQYDPFTLPDALSKRLAVGFRIASESAKHHEEQYRRRVRYFTYGRLRENLDLNGLLRPRLGEQVDIHHAFLNAFVHASKSAYERVHGHNFPSNIGLFDHYASELILLYVIVIGAAELEAFGRMSRRRPNVGLRGWDAVEQEISIARQASSYFWFLSGGPDEYDFIKEADTRMEVRSGKRRRRRPDPRSIPSHRIRYYPDPLERLIRLHGSYHELTTGQVYISPFDRQDARTRR
jgi:hypothetical protein